MTLSVARRRGAHIGLLRKTVDGRIEFPFDGVHVDFVLKAA